MEVSRSRIGLTSLTCFFLSFFVLQLPSSMPASVCSFFLLWPFSSCEQTRRAILFFTPASAASLCRHRRRGMTRRSGSEITRYRDRGHLGIPTRTGLGAKKILKDVPLSRVCSTSGQCHYARCPGSDARRENHGPPPGRASMTTALDKPKLFVGAGCPDSREPGSPWLALYDEPTATNSSSQFVVPR